MKWTETSFEDLVEGRAGLKRGPFGGAIKKEMFVPTGYKIYEQKNAIQDDCHIGSYFISEDKFRELETFAVAPGDLLVSCSGTMGKITLVPSNAQPGIINQALLRIRPRTSKVDPRFLRLLLESSLMQRRIFGGAAGVAIKNIRPLKEVRQVKLPLPPLAEQKRIAGILDAADALRAKRREALAQLDTLLQSTFLDMFGDPVTNPMGWEVAAFKELGDFVSGGTPSKSRDEYWVGPTPWVSPKDMKVSRIVDAQDHVSDSAFVETNLKLLEARHLLIVVRGMILAHSFPVAINLVPVAINQDMKAIRPCERYDVLFLMECIRHLKRQILSEVSTAGHGTKRFDGEAMKKIGVPAPPLALQRRFAAIVESVERQKARMRFHLAELDALFASVQSRAFNGEL